MIHIIFSAVLIAVVSPAACRRIDEASKFIDLEQLALSPQCGFASTVSGNPVTLEVEKAKLARVVEVANKVWG